MKKMERSKIHLFFLEALCGLVILGLVAAVIIQVFAKAYQISKSNEHRMKAAILASEGAERLKSAGIIQEKEAVWEYDEEGLPVRAGEEPEYRMKMKVEDMDYKGGVVQDVTLEVSFIKPVGEESLLELKFAKYHPMALEGGKDNAKR